MADTKQPPNGPPNGPPENRPGCLSIAAWMGGLAALVGINRAVSKRGGGDHQKRGVRRGSRPPGGQRRVGQRHGEGDSPDDAVFAEQDGQGLPTESIDQGHEVRDVRLRTFLIVAVGLILAGIAIQAGLWLLLRVWTEQDLTFDPQVPPAIVEETDAPGPDLVPVPRLEYQRYRAQEIELLHSYGQSEGQTDTARIPIERAMQILAEQGIPARDGDVPDFGLDDAYQLDSEGGVE